MSNILEAKKSGSIMTQKVWSFNLAPEATSKVQTPQKEEENTALLFPQILAAMAGAFGFFVFGTISGWTGSALAHLGQDFDIGPTEESLVVTTASAGALLGCLLSGPTMDFFGRRKTVLLLAPFGAIGWVTIGSSNNIIIVYIGRFLSGLTAGFCGNAGQVYTSEVCQANLRGRLGSLLSLCFSIGVLTSYIIGGLMPWRTSCFVFITPSVVLFVNMYVVPESPYWLLLQDKTEDARQSLSKLRGNKFIIDNEIGEMEAKISSVHGNFSYLEIFHPRTMLPLFIALFTHTLQQVSGSTVLTLYASNLFKDADISIDIGMATVYTGIAQVFGTALSLFFVDWIGRRILLIISLLSSGICTLALGSYYYVSFNSEPWPSWLPVAMFILIQITHYLGCDAVPFIITTEMFSTSVRSKANSLCNVYNRIMNIIVVQTYPYLRDASGNSTVMFLYGSLAILFAIGTYEFVPETKGKSLAKIQEYFEEKTSKKKKQEVFSPTYQNYDVDL